MANRHWYNKADKAEGEKQIKWKIDTGRYDTKLGMMQS